MDFAQQLVNGVQIGSAYALGAIGYTMGMAFPNGINFAHGDTIMVGSSCGTALLPEQRTAGLGALQPPPQSAHCWA